MNQSHEVSPYDSNSNWQRLDPFNPERGLFPSTHTILQVCNRVVSNMQGSGLIHLPSTRSLQHRSHLLCRLCLGLVELLAKHGHPTLHMDPFAHDRSLPSREWRIISWTNWKVCFARRRPRARFPFPLAANKRQHNTKESVDD
jgi:hypothetical protein